MIDRPGNSFTFNHLSRTLGSVTQSRQAHHIAYAG